MEQVLTHLNSSKYWSSSGPLPQTVFTQDFSFLSTSLSPNSTGDDVTETMFMYHDYVTDDIIDVTDHPILTYTYLVILCLTTLIGNVGNVLVIGAVVCDRRLHKESNVFILNLAIADLCITGFVDMFSIVGVFVSRTFWSIHWALCHVIGSICLVSCICSLWSITAISVNRFVLLCRPQMYYRIFSWRRSYLICVMLWLGAFLLDLPNFLGWGRHLYDLKTMACSWDRTASFSYTCFVLTMFVLLPLVIVLYCNLKIFLVFLHSKQRVAAHMGQMAEDRSSTHTGESTRVTFIDLKGGTNSHGNGKGTSNHGYGQDAVEKEEGSVCEGQQSRGSELTKARKGRASGPRDINKEMKLAKTLFIVFVVFCIAWTPYALLCLVDFSDRVMKAAYAAAILFAHGSSSFNSVLYGVTNKTFRDGYKLVLSKLHIYL